jgi:hypothetical protein
VSDESSDMRMLSPEDFERLDLEDQAEEVGYLTPREYAKLRGMAPQLVYYYIRTGVIKDELCRCGRRVVQVSTADEALQEKARQRGGALDARSDELRAEGGQGTVLPRVQETDPVEEPGNDV